MDGGSKPAAEPVGAWSFLELFLPRSGPQCCSTFGRGVSSAEKDGSGLSALVYCDNEDLAGSSSASPLASSGAAASKAAVPLWRQDAELLAGGDVSSSDSTAAPDSDGFLPVDDRTPGPSEKIAAKVVDPAASEGGAKPKAKAAQKKAAKKVPAEGQEKPAASRTSTAAASKSTKAEAPASSVRKSTAKDECPGTKMLPKAPISYLAKVKEERRILDEKAKAMGSFVDDMLAGKFVKEQGAKGGGGQPAGNMIIRMPSPYERKNGRMMLLEQFRVQYKALVKVPDGQMLSANPATSQYGAAERSGLAIQEGHQYMPRPAKVDLPKDFRKSVGDIELKKLQTFDCKQKRMLVSVYGDIFDVSDRPDKYGVDGPYAWMSGHDLTWGFLSGKDTEEQNDKLYDIWKMAPDDFREKKLQGVLAWVAFYEYEYGASVGRLKEYNMEPSLKGPPMEQAAQDCCIM